MAADPTFRSLAALTRASTSRVLNLLAISQAHGEDAGFQANPLFTSAQLNSAIIIKHRLRADETDLFAADRAIGTKIVIPFEKSDLRSGGKSLLIGQRGYEDLLCEIGHYGERRNMERDMKVLDLLDRIPSLDPFLLREHLRSHEISPDQHYFDISEADQQRMFQHAAREIRRLTDMASDSRGGQKSAIARMVEALLSNEVSEKLEPLRQTLQMSAEDFREGVFSWRGFIFYKWSLMEFWPDLINTLRQVRSIMPVSTIDREQRAYFTHARQVIIAGAKRNSDDIHRILGIYNTAYDDLIARREPNQFRRFLLEAPTLFLEIGEKMGALSHLTSFWKYRFPPEKFRSVDADELTAIFQDFSKSVGIENANKDMAA